eukprot:366278-Chlamydomonas_euryale.AAC.30
MGSAPPHTRRRENRDEGGGPHGARMHARAAARRRRCRCTHVPTTTREAEAHTQELRSLSLWLAVQRGLLSAARQQQAAIPTAPS